MQLLLLILSLALVSCSPTHDKWSSSYGWGVSHPTYASGHSKWSPSYGLSSKAWPSSSAVWPEVTGHAYSKIFPKKYSSYSGRSSELHPTSHVDYSSSYSHGWPSSYSSHYSEYPSSQSSYSLQSWPSYSGSSSTWDWD